MRAAPAPRRVRAPSPRLARRRAGPAPRATRGASLVRVAPRRRPRARLDASAPRDDAPPSSAPRDDAPSSSSSTAQLARILRAVSDAGTPFLPPAAGPGPLLLPLHPDVAYELEPGLAADGGALHACRGRDAYAALAARAPGSCDRELVRCRLAVTRAAATGPTSATVRWEARFVPQKLEWMLVAAERWPEVFGGPRRVVEFDILDRVGELSRFRWRALWTLFRVAATEGEMRVPVALVRGTSVLGFEEDPTSNALALRRHVETIELVALVNGDEVRNKRICRDLLEFLDARKPPKMPLKEWDDVILECVRWYDVPGMGQFDVDGLEDGDEREAVYADAIAALGFFTAVLLAFAWAVGGWYLKGLERDRALVEMLERSGYN